MKLHEVTKLKKHCHVPEVTTSKINYQMKRKKNKNKKLTQGLPNQHEIQR